MLLNSKMNLNLKITYLLWEHNSKICMDPVPASQDMQPSVWKTSLGVIQKVGSLRRWGGGLWKANKSEQGEGVLACVYVRFFKKNAEIFKMKFYSYSPVFPIDYNGSMKYKPPWKIIIFSPVNEWSAITFASTHKITNVGYVKNIYLQPLVVGWISM